MGRSFGVRLGAAAGSPKQNGPPAGGPSVLSSSPVSATGIRQKSDSNQHGRLAQIAHRHRHAHSKNCRLHDHDQSDLLDSACQLRTDSQRFRKRTRSLVIRVA
jgi:hypothetical protein